MYTKRIVFNVTFDELEAIRVIVVDYRGFDINVEVKTVYQELGSFFRLAERKFLI